MGSGAAGLLVGERGRQDAHVGRRASLAVVELVLRVHPFGGESLHDRVLAVAGRSPCTGAGDRGRAAGSVSLGGRDDLSCVIDGDPVTEGRGTPAEAGHLVEGGPVGEGVVGGVDVDAAPPPAETKSSKALRACSGQVSPL